tara:strand:- start:2871 stop:4022 length:1152 start_codon:yes stop_codon:yes gene_type:complete
MKVALQAIGNPCASIPAIQVVGTNGKGSIVSFLKSSLQTLGIKGGITTSPHLVDWCERICINSQQIPLEELKKRLYTLNKHTQKFNITPFELLIATALDYFNDNQVELLVLEVGLGGRLDATTAHPYRPIIAMGGIGLDHCEYLGKSLTEVSIEKTAVISPNSTVISAKQDPEVEAVINSVVKKQNATIYWVKPLPNNLQLGLAGDIQRYNAAVAKKTLELLTELGWEVDEGRIKKGLSLASWPGRLQTVYWGEMPILIDCAHNPHAARELSQERLNWQKEDEGLQWIIGIQKHKDAPRILQYLVKPKDKVWIIPVPEHSSWTQKELAESCQSLARQLNHASDIQEVLSKIFSSKKSHFPIPVVTGSIYLIGSLIKRKEFRLK